MHSHVKYTPKTHFIHLNNMEIYYNFSICYIIYALFFTNAIYFIASYFSVQIIFMYFINYGLKFEYQQGEIKVHEPSSTTSP